MQNEAHRRLLAKFRDRDYRHAYVESFLDSRLAGQIKATREARGLTQQALAQASGMTQSRISTIENVNYSRWNIKTLKRLAEVLDVALVVKFESFGKVAGEISAFDEDSLVVPSFEEESTSPAPPIEQLAYPRFAIGVSPIATQPDSERPFQGSLIAPCQKPPQLTPDDFIAHLLATPSLQPPPEGVSFPVRAHLQ